MNTYDPTIASSAPQIAPQTPTEPIAQAPVSPPQVLAVSMEQPSVTPETATVYPTPATPAAPDAQPPPPIADTTPPSIVAAAPPISPELQPATSKKKRYVAMAGAGLIFMLIAGSIIVRQRTNQVSDQSTNLENAVGTDAYDRALAKLNQGKSGQDSNQEVTEATNNKTDGQFATIAKARTVIQPETLTVFTKEELTHMGIVMLPDGFSVQEEYKGMKLVRSPKKAYTSAQLKLLKEFIDKTPAVLLDPGPSAIVTFDKTEVDTGMGLSIGRLAFASGNYLFFDDASFTGANGSLFGSTSLDDVYQAFEHELVHTMQFNQVLDQIAKADLEPKNAQSVSWTNFALGSDFVKNFAAIADWQKGEEYKKIKYTLTNPNSKTTEYGKTEIVEDMAETISMTIAARPVSLSQPRQQWAYQQLRMSASDFEKGRLPFYDGFQYAGAPGARFNKTVFDVFKTKYEYSDKQFFWLEQAQSFTPTARQYESDLNKRGWTGKLTSTVDENKVEIMSGDFVGPERDLFVEISGYDNAINYREKPVGTSIIVFSGYK